MKKLLTHTFKLITCFGLIFNFSNLFAQSPWCSASHSLQYNYTSSTYRIALEQVKILDKVTPIYTGPVNGFNAASSCGSEWQLVNSTSNAINLTTGNLYSINMSVSSKSQSNASIGVFVDLNIDNDFLDSGEYMGSGIGYYSGGQLSINFTLPCSATAGASRLRIVCNESAYPMNSSYGCTSCTGAPYFGETEDFSINIIQPTAVYSSFSTPSSTYVKSQVNFIKKHTLGYFNYSWDANNDATIEQNGLNSSYKYTWSTSGTKCIKSQSKNCFGTDDTIVCINIIAPTAAPVVKFSTLRTQIEQYEVIQLFDSSTNGPWKWQWDVYDSINSYTPVANLASGDVYSDPNSNGNYEFSKNPEFSFSLQGKYTVTLTATNDIGGTKLRKVRYITVTKPTNYMLGFGVYGNNGDNIVSSNYGTIIDNGGTNLNYSNNQGKGTRSFITIKPCAAKSITLVMSQLKFNDTKDILNVYDGDKVDFSKLLASYTKGSTSNRTVTAFSGSMHITFQSDGTGIDSGYLGTYTSVLDSTKTTQADFELDSVYYNSVPFKLKNTSKFLSGDPKNKWIQDGDLFSYEKNPSTTLFTNGNYRFLLNVEECDLFDSISKNAKIVTPTTPTKINFTASETYTSKGRVVYLKAKTNKANRFLWKISPTTYKLKNPPNLPSTYSAGMIKYNATPGDSIPIPAIEFLDTVCYTISLTAYNGLDSINTTNYLQKNDYICGKFYKNYFSIYGTIYNDINKNCILDSNDNTIQNFPVNIYDSLGKFIAKAYTIENGIYAANISDKKYTLKLDTMGLNIQINCNYPGADSLVNKNINPSFNGVNFPINCNNKSNLNINSIYTKNIVFPGRKHFLNIELGESFNLNCAKLSKPLTLKMKIGGKLKYSGVDTETDTPTYVNGNIIEYNLLGNNQVNQHFGIQFKVDTTAKGDDTISANVSYHYLENSDTIKINQTFKYLVRNSYDPNFKEVYPINTAPGFNDWLTYTIHFQNKGTAPAFNINVKDTLDKALSAETFQMLASSHNVKTTIKNSIITFKFDDIMLPDSASDPKGSEGFVQYRVKPKLPLNLGDKIKNTAYIYFDYNTAIITNTTQNECVKPNNSKVNKINTLNLIIYPNPSTGIFNMESLNTDILNSNLLIFDIYGKLIKTIPILNLSNIIDLREFANGIYLIKVNSLKVSGTAVLLKE